MVRIYISPEYLKHLSSGKCQIKRQAKASDLWRVSEGSARPSSAEKSNVDVSLASAIVCLHELISYE